MAVNDSPGWRFRQRSGRVKESDGLTGANPMDTADPLDHVPRCTTPEAVEAVGVEVQDHRGSDVDVVGHGARDAHIACCSIGNLVSGTAGYFSKGGSLSNCIPIDLVHGLSPLPVGVPWSGLVSRGMISGSAAAPAHAAKAAQRGDAPAIYSARQVASVGFGTSRG